MVLFFGDAKITFSVGLPNQYYVNGCFMTINDKFIQVNGCFIIFTKIFK